jgi:hypothetical protein
MNTVVMKGVVMKGDQKGSHTYALIKMYSQKYIFQIALKCERKTKKNFKIKKK